MTAFYRDVQAHGRDQDVLVMSWSEFGRRPDLTLVEARTTGGQRRCS